MGTRAPNLSSEVIIHDYYCTHEVKDELENLTVGDDLLPPRPLSRCAKEHGGTHGEIPEEQGSTWKSMIGWEAQEPLPVVVGHLVKDGEATTDNHDERKEAEDKAVYGGDSVEGCGGEPKV
ncbi:hypothetical protein KY290_005266 [Solanum tuberosum]|uniref:Uncharacterized protein n=1 Tax=Solanum tuberosum TaxID=4113 RepID=A0ABQ7WDQ4_SOLTU|nr:hypothetical protein KY289_005660 [Solanum tuberosum]KAH0778839.1 hypothetical protein KY290_005266 [Solanum tuberosum]